MTLSAAVMVLVFALIGIVSAHRYLRKNRTVYIFCRVLLALLALTCATYIGLTLIFVDAVRNRPPAP